MKRQLFLLLLIAAVCFTGCNGNRVEELEATVASLQEENKKLKEDIEYLQNGPTNLITQIRSNYEVENYDEVLTLSEELHANFNGCDEDIEAQEYVKNIEEMRQEEERIKQEEEQKTKEEQIKGILRITNLSFTTDYLEGVNVKIDFVNNSDKTIKYITFHCRPFNAVGDMVGCKITGDYEKSLKSTGPYAEGEGNSGKTWTGVWYNASISSVDIYSIEIEYTDGTNKYIRGDDVDLAMY